MKAIMMYNVLHHFIFDFFPQGQGHFDDESSIKQVKGDLDDIIVKDIASSADCCLALSGTK